MEIAMLSRTLLAVSLAAGLTVSHAADVFAPPGAKATLIVDVPHAYRFCDFNFGQRHTSRVRETSSRSCVLAA
jgi:hypothetical protein